MCGGKWAGNNHENSGFVATWGCQNKPAIASPARQQAGTMMVWPGASCRGGWCQDCAIKINVSSAPRLETGSVPSTMITLTTGTSRKPYARSFQKSTKQLIFQLQIIKFGRVLEAE